MNNVRGEQWEYFANPWAVMKTSEKGGEEISTSKDLRAGQMLYGGRLENRKFEPNYCKK